ncbi:hypothetical protein ACH5RR_040375 [Cinchona calisaya]|uniref:PIR2-like helical domain-containing protein n=1 Tax=Cinchona calisaya TaxID=153742 RepID=A0ABD2XVY3_9GENT
MEANLLGFQLMNIEGENEAMVDFCNPERWSLYTLDEIADRLEFHELCVCYYCIVLGKNIENGLVYMLCKDDATDLVNYGELKACKGEKRKEKKFKTKKVQNANAGLENEDSSSTEVFHDSDYEFDGGAYTPIIIPVNNEHLWKPVKEPELHLPKPIILLGRPKKVSKRKPNEAPVRRKKSSQIQKITRAGQVKYKCTVCKKYKHNNRKCPDKPANSKDQQDEQSAENDVIAKDDASVGGNTKNTKDVSVEPAATTKHAWLDELISSTVVNIASQEEMPSSNIEATKEPVISKLVALGYDEGVVLKAILRNGHCYDGMNVLTNILYNSLAYLNSGCSGSKGNSEESEAIFRDLMQLEKYSLLQGCGPVSSGIVEAVGTGPVGVVPVLCRFHSGWGFGNRGTSEFPMNGFFSYASEMTL